MRTSASHSGFSNFCLKKMFNQKDTNMYHPWSSINLSGTYVVFLIFNLYEPILYSENGLVCCRNHKIVIFGICL